MLRDFLLLLVFTNLLFKRIIAKKIEENFMSDECKNPAKFIIRNFTICAIDKQINVLIRFLNLSNFFGNKTACGITFHYQIRILSVTFGNLITRVHNY